MVLNAMTLHSGARLPSIYGPEGLYNFLSVVLKLCEVRMSQNHQVSSSSSSSTSTWLARLSQRLVSCRGRVTPSWSLSMWFRAG